jgi:hypothetical protein
MTNEEFAVILEARIESIRKIISSKAKEYAIGDKLYNFKRAAEISRTTPAKALLGMLMKHVVSVIDLVEGSVPATSAMVDEKLGDAINYLILLEAVFKEGVVMEKDSAPCACFNCAIRYSCTAHVAYPQCCGFWVSDKA